MGNIWQFLTFLYVFKSELNKNNPSSSPTTLKIPIWFKRENVLKSLTPVICCFVQRMYQHSATAHFMPLHRILLKNTLLKLSENFLSSTPTIITHKCFMGFFQYPFSFSIFWHSSLRVCISLNVLNRSFVAIK